MEYKHIIIISQNLLLHIAPEQQKISEQRTFSSRWF
jgi:hypothetical protein